MGYIFFVMGISGSGKGTLINNLKSLNDSKFHFPLSYKTRNIREGEVNGVDSHFVSKEEFFAGIRNGEFLEYAQLYDGNEFYGTKFEDVIDKGINLGFTVVKELDILGLEELRKNHPEMDEKYKTVFLDIPEDIIKERIDKRGAFMSNEELERRLNTALIEKEKSEKMCDYIIDATKSEKEILKEFLEIIKKSN